YEAEQDLFPGRVALLLFALAVVLVIREARRDPTPPSRASLWLGLTAVGFGLSALSASVMGPWRLGVPGLRVSVAVPEKPVGIAWLSLLAAAVTSRVGRSALRRRSPLWFYAGATLLLWVLALGPTPRFLGTPVWYKAPYAWLMLLPGFGSLRVPGRIAM